MPVSLLCFEICHRIYKSSQGEATWGVSPCFFGWITITGHCYFSCSLRQDGTGSPSALSCLSRGGGETRRLVSNLLPSVCLSVLLHGGSIWARCSARLSHSGPVALKKKCWLILAEALASAFRTAANLSALATCRRARPRGAEGAGRGSSPLSRNVF